MVDVYFTHLVSQTLMLEFGMNRWSESGNTGEWWYGYLKDSKICKKAI